MPSLSFDTQLIWFAHCPKAGGTSIETLMVETWGEKVGHLHWGWDLWWKRGGWREASPPNSPQHLIWADADRTLSKAPDQVFAVVRDPMARMMSEHRYQRRYRRGTWAGRALAALPFSLWLRLMLAVADRNPHAFDNHLRPQSDFIPAQAVVFHLEDGLQKVIDWLAKTTGTSDLSVPPQRLKTTPGDPPDADTLGRIVQAFAQDYERFGYDVPCVPESTPDIADRIMSYMAPLVAKLERRALL